MEYTFIKKIAITGATSMLGAALAKCALDKNIKALCITRKDSKRINNLPKAENIKIIFADLQNYSNLEISDTCDIFFHLAWDKTSVNARDDIDTQLLNIQYALDAVRLAKRLGCAKFVGAGSQAEYGLASSQLAPDTPCNPESGYGIAKYSAGKLSKLLCEQLNMRFNWTRILSIFGQNDAPHTLIMHVINELNAGRTPELTKCEQIWDYLYCNDAANALLAIGEKGINGKTYPLGSGNAKKLSEYIEIIRDIIAPNAALQFGKKDYYPHQPMRLCADITELTKDTGWKPKTSFEDGIREMINA